MSKQRGKGERRQHRQKDGRKRHDGEQPSTKFDEERFLRDMESALDRMFSVLLFYSLNFFDVECCVCHLLTLYTSLLRSFAVAGPKAWNSLSSELRCIALDSTFRHRLKVELFSRAYGVSINT